MDISNIYLFNVKGTFFNKMQQQQQQPPQQQQKRTQQQHTHTHTHTHTHVKNRRFFITLTGPLKRI